MPSNLYVINIVLMIYFVGYLFNYLYYAIYDHNDERISRFYRYFYVISSVCFIYFLSQIISYSVVRNSINAWFFAITVYCLVNVGVCLTTLMYNTINVKKPILNNKDLYIILFPSLVYLSLYYIKLYIFGV